MYHRQAAGLLSSIRFAEEFILWTRITDNEVGSMYCTNCGNEINPNAVACMSCGFKQGTTYNYCVNCGNSITPGAIVCVRCGCAVGKRGAQSYTSANDGEQKDWLTTLLLCIFLGGLGIHRFYTGHTGIGVVQLLTGGGCGIWAIIDLIQIITGDFRDANGNPLLKKN